MMYAVNKETKKHRILSDEGFYIVHEERVVQADADGWIEWMGGECPVPDYSSVEVKFSEGTDGFGLGTSYWWGTTVGGTGRITRYRPYFQPDIEQPAPQEWRGKGLPKVGDRVLLENNNGYYISHGHGVIGKEVEVKALFKSDDIDMAALEYDGVCYCFRASMLRPIRTDRERWVDQARDIVRYQTQNKTGLQAIHDALKNGDLPMPEKHND